MKYDVNIKVFCLRDIIHTAIVFAVFFFICGIIVGENIQKTGMNISVSKSVTEHGYFRLDDHIYQATRVNTSNVSEMQQLILKLNNIKIGE